LALFGRRPPQRVNSIVMPASENLNNSGHSSSCQCREQLPEDSQIRGFVAAGYKACDFGALAT